MTQRDDPGGLTRRTATAAGLSILAAPAMPFGARASAALPDNGVRFVESGSDAAERAARQYNMAHAQVPQMRALCLTSEGVAQTVRWARQTDRRFAVRSGGHCYAGTSAHSGLVIDLREMNAVSVDPATGIARVQAGAKLGELYRAAFPYALAPAAGWCGDVGVGGHALGGGLGYQVRQHGLLCDHVIALTMVTADGAAVRCSADDNADLYWALRGGGGGLGIVTEFEIALQPTGETHSVRVFGGMDAALMPTFVERWMMWSGQAPRETSTQLAIAVMADGRLLARLTGFSTQPRDAVMTDLRDVVQDDLPLAENALLSGSFEAVMENTVLSIPAFYLPSASHTAVLPRRLAADDWEPLLERAVRSRSDSGSVSFLIEAMGGALADVPRTATAFPHRDAAFLMTATCAAPSKEQLDRAAGDLAEVGRAMWHHASARGYVNYRDRSLEDYAQAYWAENLPRLRAVKRAIDPDGVFSSLHTIPL
jgi:FAD/FMN-containing dehydrogenase